MTAPPDVVIIGGGAIGVCSAYYLLERGFSVTVVERGEIGAACSYGNAGLIVPSHAIPLAAPGVWRQGVKWLLNTASPLYIKPRFNSDLARWLLLFLSACNPRRQPRAIDTLAELTHASRALFDELAAREGSAFGYTRHGSLALYLSSAALEKGAQEAYLLREHGVETQVLNAEEVRAVEPNILLSVVGGVRFLSDAHVTPHRFVQEIARAVEERGGVIQTNTEVRGFHKDGRRITGVVTSAGMLTSREIVLASGAWSPGVSRDLGAYLPIQPAKGYSITIDTPTNAPSLPLHFSEIKVVATPMGDMLRFAGTLELTGFDLSINQRRVDGIKRGVLRYLPLESNLDSGKVWRGLRPLSPDTLPILGRTQRYENLIFATGHGMFGISLAPITGYLVAQIAANSSPTCDITPLSPDRF